jgi:hypothetical protein
MNDEWETVIGLEVHAELADVVIAHAGHRSQGLGRLRRLYRLRLSGPMG